jgi:hypothetical protein
MPKPTQRIHPGATRAALLTILAVAGLGCSAGHEETNAADSSKATVGATITPFADGLFRRSDSVWQNSQDSLYSDPQSEGGQGHVRLLLCPQASFDCLLVVYGGFAGGILVTRNVETTIQSITSAGGPSGDGTCDGFDRDAGKSPPVLGEISFIVNDDGAGGHRYRYSYAYTYYCDDNLLSITADDGSGNAYQPDTLISLPRH